MQEPDQTKVDPQPKEIATHRKETMYEKIQRIKISTDPESEQAT